MPRTLGLTMCSVPMPMKETLDSLVLYTAGPRPATVDGLFPVLRYASELGLRRPATTCIASHTSFPSSSLRHRTFWYLMPIFEVGTGKQQSTLALLGEREDQ